MLNAEDNNLLCRVTGDAPMGQIMRRRWLPACLSGEVAEPGGVPVRVRLFGEDLVAFRDRDGGLGVIGHGEPCIPHAKLRSFEGVVPKTEDWRSLGVSPEGPALTPLGAAAE